MTEHVVVNTNVAHYYPKFTNPIYQAAEAQKRKLTNEILLRIKEGNFNELYPLVSNITITEKELEEIFISWWMLAREDLINNYGLALQSNDLEQIKVVDETLKSKKEEGISR